MRGISAGSYSRCRTYLRAVDTDGDNSLQAPYLLITIGATSRLGTVCPCLQIFGNQLLAGRAVKYRVFYSMAAGAVAVFHSLPPLRRLSEPMPYTSGYLTVVKVQVYSLVSSAKRHSPDFTQLPTGHRTCSFISHLNSSGSTQPGCHFRRTELFKHTSLHCPTRYPLVPGSRECTCEQSALPRSTTSEHIQRIRGSNSRSLACTSRTLSLSHDALPRFLRSSSMFLSTP